MNATTMKDNHKKHDMGNGRCAGCTYAACCNGRPSIGAIMKPDGKHIARYRQTEIKRLLFDSSDDLTDTDKQRLPICVDDLVFMLDRKGEHHNDGYFLYTTVGAMRGMFTNQKLHLTRASEMNDQLEFVNCDKERWSRIYMACFSCDTSESMAMWRMYGGEPEESVRLKFPRNGLVEQLALWKNDLATMLFRAEKGTTGLFSYPSLENVKAHLSLHDVIYQHVGRKGSGFIHYQGMYSGPRRIAAFKDARKCRKLTSYVKDAFWEYEREVRLVLEVEKELPENYTVLALDIKKLLEGVTVLLGPHDSKATRVRDIFEKANLKSEGKIEISPAKVKFKTSSVK